MKFADTQTDFINKKNAKKLMSLFQSETLVGGQKQIKNWQVGFLKDYKFSIVLSL